MLYVAVSSPLKCIYVDLFMYVDVPFLHRTTFAFVHQGVQPRAVTRTAKPQALYLSTAQEALSSSSSLESLLPFVRLSMVVVHGGRRSDVVTKEVLPPKTINRAAYLRVTL